MKKVFLFICFFYCLQLSIAQPGKPDPSFGANGIVTTGFYNNIRYNSSGSQVLVQQDGSMYFIFEAANRTIVSKRFADGNADVTYGNGGYAFSGAISNGHAVLEPDGKLVMAGSVIQYSDKPDLDDEGSHHFTSDFGVCRFNTNGTLDNTFGINGNVVTDFIDYDVATCIALEADGKIIVAGRTVHDANADFALARYNTDGSPDNTFGTNGKQTFDYTIDDELSSIAIQADNKIIGAATAIDINGDFDDILLVRFNVNGSPDSSFSGDGKKYIDFGFEDVAGSVAIQPDGKIVVCGGATSTDQTNVTNNFAIARCNINGSLDSTFSGDGKQTTNFGATHSIARSLIIEPDGKIVVGGTGLARYKSDGSFDSKFSGDGKLMTGFDVSSIALNKVGNILAIGKIADGAFTDFNVASYNTNGGLISTIRDHYTGGNAIYNNTAIQNDGKTVVVGFVWNGSDFDFAIARYNVNGTIDNTFNHNGKLTKDLGFNEKASSVAIQSDGKILITAFSQNGLTYTYFMARYNSNGSVDSSFNANGKKVTGFEISHIKLQNNGKIVVGGLTVFARYNKDGTPDVSFNATGKVLPPGLLSDFALQSDGKIVVAGAGFNVTRYNINGTPDQTFTGETPDFFAGIPPGDYNSYSANASSIAIQNDGKIVVGGSAGVTGRYNETTSQAALARFNTNGSLDHTFSDDGIKTIDFKTNSANTSIALQSDNKIVVKEKLYNNVINSSDQYTMYDAGFALARINNDGTPDDNFGTEGKVYPQIADWIANIGIDNNKLYAVGYRVNADSAAFIARYLLNAAESAPPTVSLTSPANHATYLAGGNVYLTAKALDADGAISKVEFYSGSTLLYTATDTPYTFKWEHVHLGNYILTAKATDNSGLVTTSDSIHISVVSNKPPTVSIISPANGATFLKGATVHLQATASDADGRLGKVRFYNDTTLLTTEEKVPYTYDWKVGKTGNYSITATATDNWGATTTSAAISISVVPNKPPTVSIVGPADGSTFTAPATINLEASAEDADGRIVQVSFYNGTTLLTDAEHKFPYTYQWQQVPAGTYTITAVAKDNWNAETTSAPVIVTVTPAGVKSISSSASLRTDKTGITGEVSLQLSPDPAHNILNIYTNGLQQNKPATIAVISSSGMVMKTIQTNSLIHTIQLNVSSLASGMYIIKIRSSDKVMYGQFVKI